MTTREWFMRVLPRRQADLAIERSLYPDRECASFEEAMHSFRWAGAPEGVAFWSEIAARFGVILAQMPAGFSPLRGPVHNPDSTRTEDIVACIDGEWDTSNCWRGDSVDVLYAVRIGSEIARENRIDAAPPVIAVPDLRQPLTGVALAGARYRTRGGHTTGPVLPHGDGFTFRTEPGGLTFFCTSRGACEWYSYDLVEEAGPLPLAEWLSWVPDGVGGAAAVHNMTTLGCCTHHSPGELCDTIGEALMGAFHWTRTAEGHEYWRVMYRYLVGIDSTPPAPFARRVTAPPPPPPPPVVKKKYRVTEVKHYYIEAEDEAAADHLFRCSTNPTVEFSGFAEDREINDA